MSTSAADSNKIYKNSFQWRNKSDELDVFEAARYFSSAVDHAVPAYINGRGDRHCTARPVRRSLDVPIMNRSNPTPPKYNHHHYILDQKQLIIHHNKKFKQLSSPGGRLASFLNSLFNQTSLKKKKMSKSSSGDPEPEEENPNARRRRRSSISHFGFTGTWKTGAAADKGSGFTTQPTKAYEGVDHDAAEKKGVDCEMRGWRKWREDDGGESDSSSDLFDLPNHDLHFVSSGLPVYETTHFERISIATPIFTAT